MLAGNMIKASGISIIFFDGTCPLCHAAVKYVAKHDRDGLFHFAPLGGATMRELIDSTTRDHLPDALVLLRRQGERISIESGAFACLGIAEQLGGVAAILGRILAWFPCRLLESGYSWVARSRKGFKKKPEGTCPRVPEVLRDRFLP